MRVRVNSEYMVKYEWICPWCGEDNDLKSVSEFKVVLVCFNCRKKIFRHDGKGVWVTEDEWIEEMTKNTKEVINRCLGRGENVK